MDYARARLYLMLILLSRSALFPAAQQSFADHLDDMITPPGTTEEILDNHDATNITVGPGSTLIIKDGGTLNLSGQLVIDNGRLFIIEFGGTLTLTGVDSGNTVLVNVGGHVEQYGALVSNNPSAFVINGGVASQWILKCGGTQVFNGTVFLGEIQVDECINIPPVADEGHFRILL